jgi:hypothetical protein
MMDRIAWIEGIVSRLERPALVALLGMEFWVQERSDDLHASFAGEPARYQTTPDAQGEWMEAIYTSSLSNDTTNCSW